MLQASQRFAAAHESHRRHLGQRRDGTLGTSRLRCRQTVVEKGDHRHLRLQCGCQVRQVESQDHRGPDHQQRHHDRRHGGDRHQSVAAEAGGRFSGEIDGLLGHEARAHCSPQPQASTA